MLPHLNAARRFFALIVLLTFSAFAVQSPLSAQLPYCGFCFPYFQQSGSWIGECGYCEDVETWYACDNGMLHEYHYMCYYYDDYGNYHYCEGGSWQGECIP